MKSHSILYSAYTAYTSSWKFDLICSYLRCLLCGEWRANILLTLESNGVPETIVNFACDLNSSFRRLRSVTGI